LRNNWVGFSRPNWDGKTSVTPVNSKHKLSFTDSTFDVACLAKNLSGLLNTFKPLVLLTSRLMLGLPAL
jgi:hypothetical protein